MKRKRLKKYAIKKDIICSVKQRPLAYKNLPVRTRLCTIRYVDDQVNVYNNRQLKYRRK